MTIAPTEISVPSDVIAECNRLQYLSRVRPARLQMLLLGLLRRQERRTIIETNLGIKMYVDPMSALGNFLVMTGEYERDMCAIIGETLPAGGTFVDIGGNEGFLSCVAAKKAGPQGAVILVEPQRRLKDIIRINLALNGVESCRIIIKALSDDDSVVVSLWPSSNTGASSIVRPYRWSAHSQVAQTISFPALLDECQARHADLVKIDVEGYEKEVVESMLPAIEAGRVGMILLEYHDSILKDRGIDWRMIDGQLCSAGMKRVEDPRVQFTGDGLASYRKNI